MVEIWYRFPIRGSQFPAPKGKVPPDKQVITLSNGSSYEPELPKADTPSCEAGEKGTLHFPSARSHNHSLQSWGHSCTEASILSHSLWFLWPRVCHMRHFWVTERAPPRAVPGASAGKLKAYL